MTDETAHIARAAALLDDHYAALSQHLHGDGDGKQSPAPAPLPVVDREALREEMELLPCPFCGGSAEVVNIEDGENAGGSCVSCTRCLASGNLEFGRKENFRANWNRRAAIASIGGHRND